MNRVVWEGVGEPRMEIGYLAPAWDGRYARGTQIGRDYELRYELDASVLRLEIVGGGTRRSSWATPISSTLATRRSSTRFPSSATACSSPGRRATT